MHVEDDTSLPRQGRKANIQVFSRLAHQQASSAIIKSEPRKIISTPQKMELPEKNVSINFTFFEKKTKNKTYFGSKIIRH